ncbi:MAG: hypothetical protein WD469_11120 [Paenibacillaceae bacterium]
MKMISVISNEITAIGYNDEEKSIYVTDRLLQTHVFVNRTREDFDYFKNSKQHDYFYLHILQKHPHKTLTHNP